MKPFTKEVKAKGWRMKDVAKRWGITPRRMSQIATDPKPIHWDAAAGLPRRS